MRLGQSDGNEAGFCAAVSAAVGAADLVLRIWCCRFGAADLVLQIWYCGFGGGGWCFGFDDAVGGAVVAAVVATVGATG